RATDSRLRSTCLYCASTVLNDSPGETLHLLVRCNGSRRSEFSPFPLVSHPATACTGAPSAYLGSAPMGRPRRLRPAGFVTQPTHPPGRAPRAAARGHAACWAPGPMLESRGRRRKCGHAKAERMVVSSQAPAFHPKPVTSLEETGLSPGFLADLALRTVYFAGTVSGHEVARRMALPFPNVVERLLDGLKRQLYVEVRGGSAVSSASYEYALTAKGHAKALELLDRSGYTGPAPVPLALYWEAVQTQTIRQV